MVERNNEQMISTKLEVELETLEQIKILFGSLESGNSLQLRDGKIELKLVSTSNSLAFDGVSNAALILSFFIGVASGVVSNAVFSVLCTGLRKLQINGRRVRPTEESIAQALDTIKTMVRLSEDKNGINKIAKPNKTKTKKRTR